MRRKKLLYISISLVLMLSMALSSCNTIEKITNKIPEQYTEGIKYDRDFPDDVFDIYDDAIVFESRNLFEDIVITFGTEDDFDDVVDFYTDFFEDNDIVLIDDKEDRDEYYAHGIFDGYEFRLQIQEADGEYIEDLFENIVYISTKEIDEKQIKATTKPTSEIGLTPEPTVSTTPTPTPSKAPATPKPSPTKNSQSETPLLSLEPGAWTLHSYIENGETLNVDITLQINEDNTGTFYFYDYDGDTRNFFNFTYEVSGGSLELTTVEGTVPYDAYYDDGILHLEHKTYNTNMYLSNWNETYDVYPSDSEFSAYGNWIYYEPDTGYIETISFWQDNTGFIYNWGGSGERYLMSWEFNNGIFTIYDEMDNEYSYGIAHRGDVFELRQLNGSVFFYNRVSNKHWLSSNFYLEDTNDPNVEDWYFSLYSDGSCETTLNDEYSVSYWGVERLGGLIYLPYGDSYNYYYYHYDMQGLHIWDAYNMIYYDFVEVG